MFSRKERDGPRVIKVPRSLKMAEGQRRHPKHLTSPAVTNVLRYGQTLEPSGLGSKKRELEVKGAVSVRSR